MRKGYFCILIMTAALFMACSVKEPVYVAGTYEGTAEGYHSQLVVSVETDEYKIIDIQILEEDETPLLAEIVYENIPKYVIKANSTDVDVVAGATYTSTTLLKAIEDGLEKARIHEEGE